MPPARPAQPLDSAPGLRARPARQTRRPRAPLLAPGPARTGPQTRDPRGRSQRDSAASSLGGPPGRAAAGLGVPGESDGRGRWASGPRKRRSLRPHPHLGARVCETDAGPLPGPPAGLTGAPAWAAGRGVCLRGTPRVRGGRELPPLPVVPERPPPPPPYRGAAPAGPRPAPAHWLRRARSRLRGPGAAADPLCALSFPRSQSPAFVCPPPRPRTPGTRTVPAGPALAGLEKPAAPSARSGPRQGPERECIARLRARTSSG